MSPIRIGSSFIVLAVCLVQHSVAQDASVADVDSLNSSHTGIATSQQFTKYDKVIIAHAAIGSLVWLIISPAAILAARLSTSTHLRAHTLAQGLLTSLLTVVTVILGCIATGVGHSSGHFQSSHQQMGLVLLILLCLQLLVGRFASLHSELDLRYKSVATIFHIVLGVVLSALGFAQIWLGMDLYEQKSGRRVPLAVKTIWAIIVGVFSVILVASSVRSKLAGVKKENGLGVKESLKRQRRKAALHLGKGRERGIRSDGLWVGMLDGNISGSTCMTNHTSTTMVSGGSFSPYNWQDDKSSYFSPQAQYIAKPTTSIEDINIPSLPKSPPQVYVSQVFSTEPLEQENLGLPTSTVSPLGVITEEEEEDRSAIRSGTDLRPLSWASTASESQREDRADTSTQASSRKSIKRKAVPKS